MLNLHFTINYYTRPEEILFLNFTETDNEGNKITSKYPLSSTDGKNWAVSIGLKEDTVAFNYFYSLDVDGEEVRVEWNNGKRTFDCREWGGEKEVQFKDAWYDISPLSYLWSSAFTECWEKRELCQADLLPFTDIVELRVSIPQVNEGEDVVLAGNIPELGQWNPALAPEMNEFSRNEWNLRIPLSLFILYKNIECKLLIRNSDTKTAKRWESGANRSLTLTGFTQGCIIKDLEEPTFDSDRQERVAGMVIPVFSLRSENSYGIGDFGDLKRMVDWAVATGMRAIQILPINDTTLTHTWIDSYPYNCISIYALHPQYLDISALDKLHNHRLYKEFQDRKEALNKLSQIDYETVNQLKSDYMHALYMQNGNSVLKEKKFKSFFEQNKNWLIPYAAFCFLREKFKSADFSRWPIYNKYNSADVRRLCHPESKDYAEIAYYYYIQYFLSRQLSEACEYARQNGIVLKGDIPIGISRESVDTWTEPYYFNMDSQTGAPPDPFSEKGQNWGFPTYNWSSMLADKCKWWVNRFHNMSHYFDAYRIDHILGFFRIWDIPLSSVYGLLGQFSPSLPLSVEEIQQSGLIFRKELFTEPYITDTILLELFGEKTPAIIECFLCKNTNDTYRFKEEYNTQRKIQACFEQHADKIFHLLVGTELNVIKEHLYSLLSNVLFIEDRRKKGMYHPRIGVQTDFVYKYLLNNSEKDAFNRLYNDYYYHRHNEFWYRSAGRKLPRLVQSTNMLVCGEDLGMIPGCVPWLMKDLRILSLEIESMPKDNSLFADVLKNPYLSVCTIATHDMPTFREWWEDDYDRTQHYYHMVLHHEGDAPKVASGNICEEVIKRHLESPSMLCLLSFQDWLSMSEDLRRKDIHAERINVPAESRHYWRYRMHLTIEELLENKNFNTKIRRMIQESFRI